MARWLSERFGQQFVIENRPGGGNDIGRFRPNTIVRFFPATNGATVRSIVRGAIAFAWRAVSGVMPMPLSATASSIQSRAAVARAHPASGRSTSKSVTPVRRSQAASEARHIAL
jgi:hypothetical protein